MKQINEYTQPVPNGTHIVSTGVEPSFMIDDVEAYIASILSEEDDENQ